MALNLNFSRARQSRYHAKLDTPLLRFGRENWFIRDAVEATAIFGAPGAGKSSSSARAIIMAFLLSNMGGLVLCAKNGEANTIRSYAKETGRTEDLIFVDASGAHRFNILSYAAQKLGGQGFEQNLVELMARMIEASRVAGNTGGGDGENRFFVDAAMKWLSHVFPLLLVAYGTIRMEDLNRFIASAPQNPQEVESNEWREKSFCSQTLARVMQVIQEAHAAGKPNRYAMQVVAEHTEFWLVELARLDNKPRSSIEATLTNMIYPFLAGKLKELFCTTTTVTPEMCRDGKIIVMDLPVHTYGAAGAVAQTIFKYLFGIAVQTTKITRKTRPVFLVADEAQNFLNSADADLLATARSSKTCIVYITQDLPTYYAKLGANARDTAESILSKFGTRIFHANTSRETNNYASEIIGKVEKFHLTKSRSKGASAGVGGSHQDEGGGFQGNRGGNIGSSESTSGYLDYEIPPDYFATKLRNGGPRNHLKVDAILIRNARTWKRTKRHWIQAEFSQK